MSNDRSKSAEKLLNYLAYGMMPSEALVYYLVADEDVSLELVDQACWTKDLQGRFNRAEDTLSNGTGSKYAEEHWQSVKEESLRSFDVLELEAVSELVGDE